MESFIRQMHEVADYQAMHQLLFDAVREEKFTALSNILYVCGDYFIEDLLSFRMNEQIAILKMVNSKHLQIFPEYVDSRFFGDFCVRIIRIEGIGGQALIPFREGWHMLSAEARTAAYNDIERVVRANLFVRSILSERYNPLMITPVSHRVVLPNWMHLDIIKPEEADDILSDVRRLLFGKDRA